MNELVCYVFVCLNLGWGCWCCWWRGHEMIRRIRIRRRRILINFGHVDRNFFFWWPKSCTSWWVLRPLIICRVNFWRDWKERKQKVEPWFLGQNWIPVELPHSINAYRRKAVWSTDRYVSRKRLGEEVKGDLEISDSCRWYVLYKSPRIKCLFVCLCIYLY